MTRRIVFTYFGLQGHWKGTMAHSLNGRKNAEEWVRAHAEDLQKGWPVIFRHDKTWSILPAHSVGEIEVTTEDVEEEPVGKEIN